MGCDPVEDSAVGIEVDADGVIWIDTGSRLVPIDGQDEIERVLDRLTADRRHVELRVDPGNPDDEDDPGAARAAAASTSDWLLARLAERGLAPTVGAADDRDRGRGAR